MIKPCNKLYMNRAMYLYCRMMSLNTSTEHKMLLLLAPNLSCQLSHLIRTFLTCCDDNTCKNRILKIGNVIQNIGKNLSMSLNIFL